MKNMVIMTNAEVREAIATWLEDHGVPNKDFRVHASQSRDAPQVELEVRVETEAPHMDGPYR